MDGVGLEFFRRRQPDVQSGRCNVMPRVARSRTGTITKVHVKFASMAPKTLTKYNMAVRRFLKWRKASNFPYPQEVTEFELANSLIAFI